MAQIAQTVNVLQAVILTDNEKMLLTPTYWVFYLYKVHQDATMIPIHFISNRLELPSSNISAQPPRAGAGMGGRRGIDAVSASASRDASGKVHITLVNIDPNNEQTVDCDLGKFAAKNVMGKALTSAKINDHNTFENPNNVTVKDFNGVRIDSGTLSVRLPSKSVVMLELW